RRPRPVHRRWPAARLRAALRARPGGPPHLDPAGRDRAVPPIRPGRTARRARPRHRGDGAEPPEPADHRPRRCHHARHRQRLVRAHRRAAGVAHARQAHPRGRLPPAHRPGVAMSGTFAPRPGAAPLLQQVRAQTLMEARLMLRNGEQLLLAVVIPLLVLVGGVLAAERLDLDLADGTPLEVLTPGVLALAVMSTSFTSLAIATGFERRYGVLKRLGTAPLPRSGLL